MRDFSDAPKTRAVHSFYHTLMTVGTTTPVIAADILSSPEYQAMHGTQTNQQYVDTLYNGLLGQSGTDESYWTNLLSNGTSRADVATGVAESGASQSYLASTTSNLFDFNTIGQAANALYETGLGRIIDPGALQNIGATAVTTQQVADTMVAAPEFTALHGGQNNTDFVNSLYQAGIGRVADTAGSKLLDRVAEQRPGDTGRRADGDFAGDRNDRPQLVSPGNDHEKLKESVTCPKSASA